METFCDLLYRTFCAYNGVIGGIGLDETRVYKNFCSVYQTGLDALPDNPFKKALEGKYAIGAYKSPNLVAADAGLPNFRRQVVIADFNGDGVPDLAVTNYDSGDVSILLGWGDGTFQPQRRFDATSHPFGLAAAGKSEVDNFRIQPPTQDIGEGHARTLDCAHRQDTSRRPRLPDRRPGRHPAEHGPERTACLRALEAPADVAERVVGHDLPVQIQDLFHGSVESGQQHVVDDDNADLAGHPFILAVKGELEALD